MRSFEACGPQDAEEAVAERKRVWPSRHARIDQGAMPGCWRRTSWKERMSAVTRSCHWRSTPSLISGSHRNEEGVVSRSRPLRYSWSGRRVQAAVACGTARPSTRTRRPLLATATTATIIQSAPPKGQEIREHRRPRDRRDEDEPPDVPRQPSSSSLSPSPDARTTTGVAASSWIASDRAPDPAHEAAAALDDRSPTSLPRFAASGALRRAGSTSSTGHPLCGWMGRS
jgi:hypothetical protein